MKKPASDFRGRQHPLFTLLSKRPLSEDEQEYLCHALDDSGRWTPYARLVADFGGAEALLSTVAWVQAIRPKGLPGSTVRDDLIAAWAVYDKTTEVNWQRWHAVCKARDSKLPSGKSLSWDSAWKAASKGLAGTSAQGSAGTVKASYIRVQSILKKSGLGK
jgi:hypothetical protein